MKSVVKNIALIATVGISTVAFAGDQAATGGGGQGSGSTSNGDSASSAMITAVAANGATVKKAADGTITISGGATGGVSFPATVVSHAGRKYVASAEDGVITLVPVD